MRTIFCLAAASLLAAPSQAAAIEEEQVCPAIGATTDAAAEGMMVRGTPGLVIAVREGERERIKAYGLADIEHQSVMRADSVFSLASATKQFTAAAILQLAEAGLLDLSDPLAKFVPEVPNAGAITLYQLLTNTSGIPDYAADPAGDRSKSVGKTREEMVEWITRLAETPDFGPGAGWAYSNSNYALLGLVIERATGNSLATVFQSRLFEPAQMTKTAFDDPTEVVFQRARGYRREKDAPSGFRNAAWIHPSIPGAAGGLRTTAGDLLRWSAALLGGRILSAESLAKMFSPGLLSDRRTTRDAMPVPMQEGWKSDYGLGVFIAASPLGRRIWHTGDIDGFATWLSHYPERDTTIALLVNSQSIDPDWRAIEAALACGDLAGDD